MLEGFEALAGCGDALSFSDKKGGCWLLLTLFGIVISVNHFVAPSDNPKERHAQIVLISVGIFFGLMLLVSWISHIKGKSDEDKN